MKQKIYEMLVLQNKMNLVVNPNWKSANYPWYDCIMVEGVEAFEHFGYKFWKHTEPNIPQVKMEMVDIWHFMLSVYISYPACSMKTFEELSEMLLLDIEDSQFCSDVFDNSISKFPIHIKFLVCQATLKKSPLIEFLSCLKCLDMSFDELYEQYIGKNCLNFFRQDNGYKSGTYHKTFWDGREDNEHLVDILNSLKDMTAPENLFDYITSQLSSAYHKNDRDFIIV